MSEPPIAISVVPYEGGRVDEIVGLILNIQRGEYGIAITAEDQPDLRSIPEFYQRGSGNFWLALHEGRLVGTIGLKDIGEGRLVLRKMFVAKAYRGPLSNAASSLLGTAVDWAKRKGTKEILLGTTEKFLAAHRFYERKGFVRIDKEKLPPSFPVMKVDTWFYKLSLDA
jgi:N-acetylglutamate synthase-like GNAT family acetyltransferase